MDVKNLVLNTLLVVFYSAIIAVVLYGGYRVVHKIVREFDNTVNVVETSDRIKKYCVDDVIVYEHLDSHSITTTGQLCVK